MCKLKGAGLLKVVSIIMIILGAISVASGAMSMSSGRTLVNVFAIDEFAIQYFIMLGTLSLVTGAVMAVFGIFGVRLCNRADKAGLLLVLGIINIVITAFSTLYNYVIAPMGISIMEQVMQSARDMYGTSMYSPSVSGMAQSGPLMALGFILPALFILGAFLNRMQPKATQTANIQPEAQGDSLYAQNDIESENYSKL